ncbi:HAD-IA family hydrolase [Tranquillimonas alkanivorans]|uniref:phosphoglycolate phosphatase n=1 Tax=Tranquillimonas alkanivorans TaxID=441119 RepID=A0A1I5SIU3_9RHOB|nr:HAD-IA family hydrolase [Tranquillimonas alkanivorans]SFP70690.1 phosphoglycolate phosphatase [Tranquillimonas alkanivorans]
MRTVIFDLDGTLADTGADLIAAANACFRGLGHGDLLDPVADKATAFRGGRAMLELGFSRLNADYGAGHVDEQYPLLLDSYGENICVETTLYPGAAEAIARLRADGYKVGICTNKPEGLAETLLARLEAREWFGSLIGADTLTVRKPDPGPLREAVSRAGGDMAHTVLVGDTVTDRKTAQAAGCACLLVTFGPDGEAVAELEPDGLLAHFDDLPAEVARLIG